MSEEPRCPRCNAPFWYLIGVNTRKFECGSYTQFPSMACRYASHLQERIKRLEEFTNRFLDPEDLGYVVNNYVRDDAREALGRERVEAKP